MHAAGQVKCYLQLYDGQNLQNFKHELCTNDPARNLPVAMITILQNQMVRRNGLPERKVIERFQPLFHILNILKYDHSGILVQSSSKRQIDGSV